MDIAHQKLACLNERDIKLAEKNGSLNGLVIKPKDSLNPCLGCLKGKARKGTPSTSTTVTQLIGDLTHFDIIGPILPVSTDGHKFILAAVDDKSNMLFTWAMKTKKEAFEHIRKHLLQVKNSHGAKIIRTDNGGEFKNNKLERFLVSEGIAHQFTNRYSSFQNGVEERANLTLLNGMRAIHITSDLPHKYWQHSMNTVTHARNHSPSTSISSSTTPIEIWTGDKADFTHLRTFGETCFPITEIVDRRKAGSTKLWDRAHLGRFVGYGTDTKGYTILLQDESIYKTAYSNVHFIKSSGDAHPTHVTDAELSQPPGV
jgi:transposase InsO family protein